jgi:hypothetical protein
LKRLKNWDSSLYLVPQPVYSPDIGPCDFFVFGSLKHHLKRKHLTREDQMISAVGEVFDKILLQTFHNVMDDWQHRLRGCTQREGEYLL